MDAKPLKKLRITETQITVICKSAKWLVDLLSLFQLKHTKDRIFQLDSTPCLGVFSFYQLGMHEARTRLVLRVLYVPTSVCVCVSTIITCAKLRHFIAMHKRSGSYWKFADFISQGTSSLVSFVLPR